MKFLTVTSLIAGLSGTIMLAIAAIRLFPSILKSIHTLESLTGIEFGTGKEDKEMDQNREKRRAGNRISVFLTVSGLLLVATAFLLQLVVVVFG